MGGVDGPHQTVDFGLVALVLLDVRPGGDKEGEEVDLPVELRVLPQEDLVRPEPPDDVLAGLRPVHAHDGVLGTERVQPAVVLHRPRRGGDALHLFNIDGRGKGPDAGLMTSEGDGAFGEVDLGVVEEAAAAVEEVVDVRLRLETHQVRGAQALTDRGADGDGEQLPEVGRGPGNVDEVVDERAGKARPDHAGHQVQMVVVEHNQRRGVHLLDGGLCDYGVREGLVHQPVARRPGVVDHAVDIGRVGRAPHVVLEKPEERVAEDVVELVVYAARGRDVADGDPLGGQRRANSLPLRLLAGPTVAFAEGVGHPGELVAVDDAAQGGYDRAAARSWLQTAFRGKAELQGAPIACDNQRATLQQRFA